LPIVSASGSTHLHWLWLAAPPLGDKSRNISETASEPLPSRDHKGMPMGRGGPPKGNEDANFRPNGINGLDRVFDRAAFAGKTAFRAGTHSAAAPAYRM
jgi:hypothetical protein